ncbi:SIR2 family NAD-dependent protein deacylase [Hyalangium versicolor]|uniref:SIR2 family NAD-dependent protein deacylase n=1 Tax=Hyalangium versicolor TaxID=2861190 RepID=UPI001CCA3B2B|nr:SIR2 family protein [Hyalangium versicolor]
MTPKLPGLLVRYIQEKRCVVFVGAGLSAGAGLPTWGALLEMGIDEVVRSLPEGEEHQDELRELVKRGKLLEVAEFCRDKLGPAYHQFLTEKVRGDQATLPATHDVLMQLPFSAWVTTNYDKLLERAYSKVLGGYPRTLTHKDTEPLGRLLFEGGRFILKAHGDIDRPDTVVLTSHDYSEIIHANPAFNEAFSGLLLSKALFFVGYSLSDPDFRLLMDRQLTHFKGFVPERFALMMDVGRVERDVLWRTARIRVISYEKGKHGQVLQFLEDLKAAVLPQPVAQAVGGRSPEGREAAQVVAPPQVVSHNQAPPQQSGLSRLMANVWPGSPSPPASAPAPAAGPARGATAAAGGVLPNILVVDPPEPPKTFPLGLAPESLGSPLLSFGLESYSGEASDEEALLQPAPIGPDVLALERFVRGQVKFRLTRQGQEVADGIAQAALNREIGLFLQKAAGEGMGGELPASRYEELTRIFEKHGVWKVLDVLGTGAGTSQAPLVLRVPPRLSWFPWELLPVQGQPMCLQRKLVRVPVGVPEKARGAPRVRPTPRVLLIGGRGGGNTERELERITRQYPLARGFSCTVLHGADATFARVMAELDAGLPDLLHYSGQVGRVDGELFLKLSGDVDLSEGTLRSILSRGRLPFLVLNAPSSAFAPPVFGWYATEARALRMPAPASDASVFEGREGFMDLATDLGVGAFIGAFDGPNAEAGTAFMAALHHDLATGLPVADAVLRARQEVRKAFPSAPTALQYVLSGDGELQLWDSRRENIHD